MRVDTLCFRPGNEFSSCPHAHSHTHTHIHTHTCTLTHKCTHTHMHTHTHAHSHTHTHTYTHTHAHSHINVHTHMHTHTHAHSHTHTHMHTHMHMHTLRNARSRCHPNCWRGSPPSPRRSTLAPGPPSTLRSPLEIISSHWCHKSVSTSSGTRRRKEKGGWALTHSHYFQC